MLNDTRLLLRVLEEVARDKQPDGAIWLDRDGPNGSLLLNYGALRRGLREVRTVLSE